MNMLKIELEKLVKQVEEKETPIVLKDLWRLNFHLMPPVGWLNDPNGLCYFKGEYHVFFQYAPFNPKGGLKFWGHYKSKNLLDWEYVGVPLIPEQYYDCHGVYSGCAFVEDDKMYLFYTGNVKYDGDYNYITNGRGSNTILVQSEDGIHMGSKQCLITTRDYPKQFTCHIRDPKVWKEENMYYMILGARDKKDKGNILLYKSKDKIDWQLLNIITTETTFGFMWECPDLFQLEQVTLLSVSPQGLGWDTKEKNLYQSGYFFVQGDVKSDYTLNQFTEWDYGFDFYAPQTFEDNKGRRILIAWMGMPDADPYYTNPTVQYGWQHALTFPRVLSLKNGVIYQEPVEEIKQLRGTKQVLENGQLLCNLECYEVLIENKNSNNCRIELNKGLVLKYKENLFSISFTKDSLGYGRKERKLIISSCTSIRMLVDHSSIEVFLNNGEAAITSRFYPENGKSNLIVTCEGSRTIVWNLKET